MFIFGNRLFIQGGDFIKTLVLFSDSATAEALKDLCYVHSDVNQSQMVRILFCCELVGEVAIICATVQ